MAGAAVNQRASASAVSARRDGSPPTPAADGSRAPESPAAPPDERFDAATEGAASAGGREGAASAGFAAPAAGARLRWTSSASARPSSRGRSFGFASLSEITRLALLGSPLTRSRNVASTPRSQRKL